ncbi:FecR family protein [Mangrovibacterium sp.]|uniref:FecR family protein n=1 Tax=Mangrovibacterium sp. TaxID=1961364 RepID=UPI0035692C6D
MNRIYEIFYAVLSNTATSEEMARFEDLLKSEENQLLFDQVKKIWNQAREVKDYTAFNSALGFHGVRQKIQQKKVNNRRYLSIAVASMAASILIMFGLLKITGLTAPSDPLASVTFQTEFGNRSVVVLPDSTKVWLNSQSKISYNAGFGTQNRDVALSGEGYFDVSHSETPFVVNVNDFKVKVHGTTFNISAYSQDQEIVTSLESGKISIEKPGVKEFVLTPGQLVVYNRNAAAFRVRNGNVDEISAWKNNKVYLHGESLNQLAVKIERKFNVKIHFKPESLGQDVHYSGVFSDENVEEVLDAISIASDLKYTKSGDQYYVTNK